jgi:hypothetical protein
VPVDNEGLVHDVPTIPDATGEKPDVADVVDSKTVYVVAWVTALQLTCTVVWTGDVQVAVTPVGADGAA